MSETEDRMTEMDPIHAMQMARRQMAEMETLGLNTDRLRPLLDICIQQQDELDDLRRVFSREQLEDLKK